MSKWVEMIGWEDSPHLQPPNIAQSELDELEASLLPHQRQARRTGRPALGTGAIYPVEEDSFLIDPIQIPDHWRRAYALDVGWHKTACLWGAVDLDTGLHYLTHEYYQGEREPIIHAHAIRSAGSWMRGCIDPAAEGSSQRDGRKLKREYIELGLNLVNANNAVEAGIHHVLMMLQGGQLKVFNTLANWVKEYRLYRRDDKAQLVKQMDHLMDDTRYLLNTRGIWSTQPTSIHDMHGGGEW